MLLNFWTCILNNVLQIKSVSLYINQHFSVWDIQYNKTKCIQIENTQNLHCCKQDKLFTVSILYTFYYFVYMSEFISNVSLNICECPRTYLFQTLEWGYVCLDSWKRFLSLQNLTNFKMEYKPILCKLNILVYYSRCFNMGIKMYLQYCCTIPNYCFINSKAF